MQYGHSKDHRPDLPQLKLMAAVAQPTSCPIACDIVPGHRADDVLYLPLIERVRRQLQRTGLLYMGDCKMAALGTRADIAYHEDYYLTVLPRTGENAQLIDSWIADAVAHEETLRTFYRPTEEEEEKPVRLARAREFERTCAAQVGSEQVTWSERVQLVRTEALAEHHGEQLERRLREAETALHHLTPAVGRGRRQHREEGTLREAVAETLREYDVAGLLEVRWHQEEYGVGRAKKAGTGAEPKVRYAITEVRREEEAIAQAKARYGWRVQVTNTPVSRCDLLGSILLYNGGWSVERDWHMVKDRPLGIQPLDVRREDQIGGLTKLLLIALRVLTFIEVVVRGRLAEAGEELQGLYEGQPSRKTSRPTAVRLLRAVSRLQMTVSHVVWSGASHWLLTPLPRLLNQILTLLGLPSEIYTRLATDTG
jgi:transposase